MRCQFNAHDNVTASLGDDRLCTSTAASDACQATQITAYSGAITPARHLSKWQIPDVLSAGPQPRQRSLCKSIDISTLRQRSRHRHSLARPLLPWYAVRVAVPSDSHGAGLHLDRNMPPSSGWGTCAWASTMLRRQTQRKAATQHARRPGPVARFCLVRTVDSDRSLSADAKLRVFTHATIKDHTRTT